MGQINKRIFGSNILGLDPANPVWPDHYYKRADYGLGIWDPKENETVGEIVELAKKAGLSTVRFATGNYFNWKETIGKERKRYFFGLDEFLKTLEKIGSEPVITISYFTGNEQDAADLVEYLNAPNDGKHPWAEKRAVNGHAEPYGVKYFEMGNEVFVVRENIKEIQPEDYASKYLAYQKAMKDVDGSVQLGLNLHHYDWRWDRKVLEHAGDRIDFVIRHIYPPKDLSYYKSENDYNKEELFEVVLGSLVVYTDKQFIETQNLVRDITGKEDIHHAITEYNIGLDQKEPQYVLSLGAALVNAELLKIYMKPENKILMANNWNFISDSWGSIHVEEDFKKHGYRAPIDYRTRPNYYVHEFYNEHFGDVLISSDVQGNTYDIGKYAPYMKAFINKRTDRTLLEYEWLNNIWLNRIKRTVMRALQKINKDETVMKENLLVDTWKISKIAGVEAENKDGILKVHFRDPAEFNYYHSEIQSSVEPSTYYKLSGYIKAEQLIDKYGVSLGIVDGRGWTKTHSGAQTTKVTGTVDWQYVELVYKTLPDATSVKVMASRVGKEGPLIGDAFFKDVKLQKYIPPETIIPYLSVNASKSGNGEKIYLMVVNKNMHNTLSSLIKLEDFLPFEKAVAWILNGPSVDATNEHKPDNVKVAVKTINIKSNSFEFTFEPHSLTAIEIERAHN